MGRFDRLRPKGQEVGQTTTPLEATRDNDPDDHDRPDGPDDSAIARPVQLLLAIGIDGQGPLTSAVELADAARTSSLTTEEAVARVARTTIIRGATGGFITGLGGFSAMPVALPVNVVEFYVQAGRMVSAIAILRGHDVGDSQVRKAVLQTLVRTQHDSVLVKAVAATRAGALTWGLLRLLPSGALLVASKGIGFRLLRAMAERLFGRFGRGVPFIGGIVVATTDGWNMWRIAERAMIDFPAEDSAVPGR
jgi:hypothetical protein